MTIHDLSPAQTEAGAAPVGQYCTLSAGRMRGVNSRPVSGSSNGQGRQPPGSLPSRARSA